MSDFPSSFTPIKTPDQPALSPLATTKSVRRREKIQLSCTLCRSKKLKCDRNQPCRSCSSRGLPNSCIYLVKRPSSSQIYSVSAGPSIQNKIKQLEGLVVSLMSTLNASKQAELRQRPPQPTHGEELKDDFSMESLDDQSKTEENLVEDFGRIRIENSEMKYVGSGHWTAILDGISELKDHFEDSSSSIEETDLGTSEFDGPELLFGCKNYVTKEEILAAVPERPVVDRLVRRYFESMDMAPAMVHCPTFLKEYEKFWANPSSTPTMWLGLLFGIMSLAMHFQRNTGTPSAQQSSTMAQRFNLYRTKLVQSLVLAKYTKTVPYTIPTLLAYFSLEYFQYKDTEIGCWVLLGMIIHIAMRFGYHRDASHYPGISPYHGEMRRRAWAMLKHVDHAISQQVGLPQMIRDGTHDASSPRNLLDTDFDEDIVVLPDSRPDTVLTPILYVIIRNKFLAVYARIVELAVSTTPSYSTTMEMDTLLLQNHTETPEAYQYLPIQNWITLNPNNIMQRLHVSILFHSSRCILHRRYLIPGRTNSSYAYSRNACLSSALSLLQHQKSMYEETQPGGQLYVDKWKVSSFLSHDFLVGTTILCLDLDLGLKGAVKRDCEGELDMKEGRERVVEALRGSERIWFAQSRKSKEAMRAAEALRVVLGKAGDVGLGVEDSPSNSQSNPIQPTITPPETLSNTSSPKSEEPFPPLAYDNISWDPSPWNPSPFSYPYPSLSLSQEPPDFLSPNLNLDFDIGEFEI